MKRINFDDKLTFWVCLIGAVICFFLAQDARACTENKTTLNKIERQLVARMYDIEFKKDDICFTDSCLEELKISIEDKAKQIVIDNFGCKEGYKLLKVEVLKDLRAKQANY